jgi:SAM-dependent methyltransferase
VTQDEAWSSRHAREVGEVLAEGDPRAIKQLYVNLGSFLEDDYGAAAGSAPLLSLPETGVAVERLLGDVRGRLLDAGCGPNPAVAIALGRDPRRSVVALDIGLGTVRLAVAGARGAGVRLLGVVGDVEALPFRDGAFDGGVCDDTIEHLPDDDRGASELARVLKCDGCMVVATPNRRSIGVLRRKVLDRLRRQRRPPSAYYAAESHLREYTWSGLERVLDPYLRVRERAGVGWSGAGMRRVVSRLVALPGARRLSRMVIVVVEPRTGCSGPSSAQTSTSDPSAPS